MARSRVTLYGYARVSTVDQETELQRVALRRAGVACVVEEKRSGVAVRPLLEALLKRLRPGDVLVVYKVDRLARSLVDLLRILGYVELAGAAFRSLTEPIETGTPLGRLMLQLLGSFAEFERSVIRERCMAGRAAAVERGVKFGRPPKLSPDEVMGLLALGLSQSDIAREFGCHPSSVNRVVQAARGMPRRIEASSGRGF